MKYRKLNGYKYIVDKDEIFYVPFLFDYSFDQPKFSLTNGYLIAHTGYLWDGPSGPTYDDNTNMTPSLFHDMGYEAIRQGLLPEYLRKPIDEHFRKLCRDRNMSWLRSLIYLRAVRRFAWLATKRRDQQEPKNTIYEAP